MTANTTAKYPAVEIDEDTRYVASAVYTAYTELRRLPTLAEVERYCNLGAAEIKRIWDTEEFATAAQALGVPWRATGGLTSTQLLALQVLTNPMDKRDVKTKLKGLDVSYAQYQAWMRQPAFEQYMHTVTENLLTDHLPDFNRVIVDKAMRGDLNAIKYANELSGRHDPNKQQVADLKVIVGKLLEIIMRNVTDQETLTRISNEFQLVMSVETGKQTIKGELNA